MKNCTFDQWLGRVDKYLIKHGDVAHDDLPNICFLDLFDKGLTPAQGARQVFHKMIVKQARDLRYADLREMYGANSLLSSDLFVSK